MVFLEPIVDSTGCCQMRTGNDCSRAPAVSSLCQGWGWRRWLGGPSGGGTSPLQKGKAQDSELPTFLRDLKTQHSTSVWHWIRYRVTQDCLEATHVCLPASFVQVFLSITRTTTVLKAHARKSRRDKTSKAQFLSVFPPRLLLSTEVKSKAFESVQPGFWFWFCYLPTR